MQLSSQGILTQSLQALLEHGSPIGLSDGELIERYLNREPEVAERAFAILVDRHGRMVLGVCRGVLGSTHDAEDAFQATFLALAQRASTLRRPERVGAFLFEVARRSALRARRRRGRTRETGSETAAPAEPACAADDPPALAARHEESRILIDELDKLAPRYRSAIVLCDLEGLPHAEAASRLGCAEGTVSARVSRGRGLLRKRLLNRGLGACTPIIGRYQGAQVPVELARRATAAAGAIARGAPISQILSVSASLLAKDVIMRLSLLKYAVCASAIALFGGAVVAYGVVNSPRAKAEPVGAALHAQEPVGAKPPAEGPRAESAEPGLQSAQARKLSSYEARFDFAIVHLRRLRKLFETKAVSEEIIDEATAKVELLRQEVADRVGALQDELDRNTEQAEMRRAELAVQKARFMKERRILGAIRNTADPGRLAEIEGDVEIAQAELNLAEVSVRISSNHDVKIRRDRDLYASLLKKYGNPGDPIPPPGEAR